MNTLIRDGILNYTSGIITVHSMERLEAEMELYSNVALAHGIGWKSEGVLIRLCMRMKQSAAGNYDLSVPGRRF